MNKSSLILLSSLVCGCLLHADDKQEVAFMAMPKYLLSDAGSYPTSKTDKTYDDTFQANKINIRQIEGKGIGYTRGYTTLEVFLTPFRNFDSWLPFIDARGHRFDNGKYALNAGVGFRFFTPSNCMIWGVNAYYDYRQTNERNYRQVGLGLEALSRRWDYRINGYVPVGRTSTSPYDVDFDKFSGHRLFVKFKREFVMPGVDAEAAYHWMPKHYIDITGAFGPYYYHGKFNKFAAGGKVRAKATFLNAISIEGIASYDNLFKWNGQGQIAFSIPLGRKLKDRGFSQSCCRDGFALEQRLVQPVQRAEIIVADIHHETKAAINPATGLPYTVWFVDNDPVDGNGTFENRFLFLSDAETAAQVGDIVYIFAGDGTTTNYNTGFVMKDQQKLFGSGIPHKVATTLGKVKIPAFSNNYPAITNTAMNNIILLGNNAEVSGLSFPNSSPNDLQAVIIGLNTTNAQVENNIIRLNSGSGIVFFCCNGTVNAINNQIIYLNSNGVNGIGATDTLPGSTSTPASCFYTFANNVIIGAGSNLGNPFSLGLFLVHEQPSGNIHDVVVMQNNLVTNLNGGMLMIQNTPLGFASVQAIGNTIDSIIENPVFFSSQTGNAEFIFSNNKVTNSTYTNVINAVGIFSCGAITGGSIKGQIDNNLFSGNLLAPSFGAFVDADPTTSMCIQVNNNIFDLGSDIHSLGGTLNLEQPFGNVPPVTIGAGVTIVPPGTCE